MDKNQKEVLRRKRMLLAKMFDFSPKSQQLYMELGLLSQAEAETITTESTDFTRMVRFLDLVAESNIDGFHRLMDLFAAKELPWLRDEMYADYLAEKGDLKVEEYVYREAGMVVHKHFGRSKRVSEFDKKEIQGMMALRYQAAKEAYKHQTDLMRREKELAQKAKWRENGRMKELVVKIRNWLRINRNNTLSHDIETPANLVRDFEDPENNKFDYFIIGGEYVDKMLKLMQRLLLEREGIDGERARCLKVLKIHDGGVKLDIEIADALWKLNTSLKGATEDKEEAERKLEISEAKYNSYRDTTERKLHEKDERIKYLEDLAAERLRKIRELENLLHKYELHERELIKEVEWWRKYATVLEKSRRMGYFNPKWNEKMFADLEGMEMIKNNKNHYRSLELLRSYPSTTNMMKKEPRRDEWKGIKSQQHTEIKLTKSPTKMPQVASGSESPFRSDISLKMEKSLSTPNSSRSQSGSYEELPGDSERYAEFDSEELRDLKNDDVYASPRTTPRRPTSSAKTITLEYNSGVNSSSPQANK